MKQQEVLTPRFYLPLCMVQFLVAFEFSAVNVAIPGIQEEFQIGVEYSQWLLSAYAIAFASSLLLGGKITDIIGARTAFKLSLSVFLLSTIISALSHTYTLLLISRVLQGLSASVAVPAALRIITEFAHFSFRNKILSWWGTCASLGFAMGVVAGGVLTHTIAWQAIFWVCAVIALSILLSIDPSIKNNISAQRIDIKGSTLLFVCSASGISALSLLATPEYHHLTNGLFLLSLLTLTLFIIVENSSTQPVFPKGFLGKKSTLYANLYNISAVICGGSMVYFISEYAYRVLNWSELTIGLALVPDAIAAAIGAKFAVSSLKRLGTINTLIIGFSALAIGMFGLSSLDANTHYIWLGLGIITFTSLVGFGLVLTGVVCTIWASSDLERDCHGISAGLINASQQWGLAVGLALLITYSHRSESQAFTDISLKALWGGGIIGFVSCLSLLAYQVGIKTHKRRLDF